MPRSTIAVGVILVALVVIISIQSVHRSSDRVLLKPQIADLSIADEPDDYLVAIERTAMAGNMSAFALKDRIRELSIRCKRPKLEIFRFVRQMARRTYDLKGSLEMTPAMCDEANSTDRDLIKPGPL